MSLVDVSSGTGGGTTTGNVAWGPSFGNPQELTTSSNLTMPAVTMIGELGTQSAFANPYNAIAYFDAFTTQAALSQSENAVFNAMTTGSHVTNPSNNIIFDMLTTQSALTNPANALSGTMTTASHFTGSALGAPFFQSATTVATTAQSTSATVTAPADILNNDLLLFLVAAVAGAAFTIDTPSGMTLVRNTTITNLQASSFSKIASSESGNYTFTASGGGSPSWCITCMLIRGVDQTTPVNVSDGATGNATDPIAPTITTTAVNCLIVCWCSQQETLAVTYTAPSGYTERSDLTSTNVSVAQGASTTDTKLLATASATGTATMNSTQLVASNYCAQHIAIAPGPVTLAS